MSKFIWISIIIITTLAFFFGVPIYEKWRLERAVAEKKRQMIVTDTAILKSESELKAYCSSADMKILKGTARDVDGGTKAHAHATASITAEEGNFIMASSIQTDRIGTRGFRNEGLSTAPIDALKDTAIRHAAVKSASYTVNSDDRGLLGDAHAESIAIIIGKTMPLKCLKIFLSKSTNAVVTD